MKETSDNDAALKELFRAIASRNSQAVSGILAGSPHLARQRSALGASRQTEEDFFFAEINHYAYAGDTALHIAAAAHEPPILASLILHGADVHARNRRGAAPLHYAADGVPGSPAWNPDGQAAVIRQLIVAGAHPDSSDMNGVAPLHRAVRTRCASAVGELLAAGSSPRLRNNSGSTPLHLAVQNTGRGGSGSALAREQQEEIIRLLLRHGARPSDRNGIGKSALQCISADWIRELFNAES